MKSPYILLIFALLSGLTSCDERDSKQQNVFSTETIAVKTYPLQSAEQAVSVTGTGMLSTENEAKYAFKIGGVIDRIYVHEGQSFSKGSLLATLKLDEIAAGEDQAKLGLEKSARDMQRITNLYNDSVATLEQLQNTQTANDIARKQLEALTFNKQYAYIYAAHDGFVVQQMANEGEIAGAGMPVLAINENGVHHWVLKIGMSDKDWALVEVNDPATVLIDAYPNHSISGQVFRKAQAASPGSGSFQIDIKLDLADLKPALGMFGKATIETKTIRQYQSIPYDALVEADGKKAFVFVPTQDGKVKRMAVEIADFDNTEVQISSGLETAREVIHTNTAFLNENSIITVIK
jgi:RND family efflux transporter MFP subunit